MIKKREIRLKSLKSPNLHWQRPRTRKSTNCRSWRLSTRSSASLRRRQQSWRGKSWPWRKALRQTLKWSKPLMTRLRDLRMKTKRKSLSCSSNNKRNAHTSEAWWIIPWMRQMWISSGPHLNLADEAHSMVSLHEIYEIKLWIWTWVHQLNTTQLAWQILERGVQRIQPMLLIRHQMPV